jgi:hypothetical protein
LFEFGVCPACGRPWCGLTKSGRVHAHKRWDDRPRIENIKASLRAAQELLDDAWKALEKLEPDRLCTMDRTCPNR